MTVAKRLECIKPIPSDATEHKGPHIHSLDKKVVHFCDARYGFRRFCTHFFSSQTFRCENCGDFCTLPCVCFKYVIGRGRSSGDRGTMTRHRADSSGAARLPQASREATQGWVAVWDRLRGNPGYDESAVCRDNLCFFFSPFLSNITPLPVLKAN